LWQGCLWESSSPPEREAGDQRRGRDRGVADAGVSGVASGRAVETEPRNQPVAASLDSSEKKIFDLLNPHEAVHIDDIVVRSGLNSSEVLATLFDLEKGIVRQMPGKQFHKVLR